MNDESDIEYFHREIYESLGVSKKYRGAGILVDSLPFETVLIHDDVKKKFDAMMSEEVRKFRRQFGEQKSLELDNSAKK